MNVVTGSPVCALPYVVQLGFAGNRKFEPPEGTGKLPAGFLDDVQRYLTKRLADLRCELGLGNGHFFCGISQVAIGADMLFSRACRENRIPQRVFLPQHREEYLTTKGSNDKLDFDETEQKAARELLASDNVIQERVVSSSPDRHERFEDTNLEILRVSDVIVCLLSADVAGKPGGTDGLLDRAKKRGRPTLEIRVSIAAGQPVFTETWHRLEKFKPPVVPREIRSLQPPPIDTKSALPSIADYCGLLKTFGSKQAQGLRDRFQWAARIIILTHVAATVCATVGIVVHGTQGAEHAVATHNSGAAPTAQEAENGGEAHVTPASLKITPEDVLIGLLISEFLLLAMGFGVHMYLHHRHAGRDWAFTRLLAEICRSVGAVGKLHLYLDYLFRLPFPHRAHPILRTLNVLHLHSTRTFNPADWKAERRRYVEDRVGDEARGQIKYYSENLPRDKRWRNSLRRSFRACSAVAMLVVLLELACPWLGISMLSWVGIFAILLPVLAVGAMSFAAAMDLEARIETYGETLEFLKHQKPLLEQAASLREFQLLLVETEARLLEETAGWFSRRSFLGVA